MSDLNSRLRRALGYFRMSDDDQEGSIPQQREWASIACARESLNLARDFCDEGISGSKDDRLGLQALLAEAERAFEAGRPYEVLVCWKLNRLSRSNSFRTAAVYSRLMDAGVSLILTQAGWVDLNDVTQRVMLNLEQDLSREKYLIDLSEDVLRGMAHEAKKGRFLSSRVPFGYVLVPGDRERDPAAGKLRPEGGPVEGMARKLFRDALDGASLAELARSLNASGLPSPRGKRWTRSTVRAILANPVYTGAIVWNATHFGKFNRTGKNGVVKDITGPTREASRMRKGRKHVTRLRNTAEDMVVVPGAHDALVSVDDWNAVQKSLASRRSRSSGRGKSGQFWTLSGLLHCQCGAVMHAAPRTQKRGDKVFVYRYYQCSRKRDLGASGCPTSGMVVDDWAVREAARLLKEKLGGEEARGVLREQIRTAIAQQKEDVAGLAGALRQRCAELATWIAQGNRNLALLPSDRLPGVIEQIRVWETERAETSARLAVVEEQPAADAQSLETADRALELIDRLDEVIEMGTSLEIRQALCPLVEKITVTFREATADDRRGANKGRLQFVPDSMKLDLQPALLNLFNPADQTGHVQLSVEGPVVWP